MYAMECMPRNVCQGIYANEICQGMYAKEICQGMAKFISWKAKKCQEMPRNAKECQEMAEFISWNV